MEVGLVTAFIGGVLAILSPCGALLLPAFFASVAGTGPRLMLHGAVFFVGLLVVLVPLGIGVGALGTLFVTHRDVIIGVAAIILVVLGVLQIFGVGFDPSRILPGGRELQQQAASRVGFVKTFLLGAASGVAGFCTGPILGAVLTVAATQGSPLLAGVLLAVYGAGMLVPLLAIAAAWHRIGTRARRLLRGRSFTVLGREFHTTSVITGTLIVVVGVLFWTTNGLISAPELLPTSVSAWLQGKSSVLASAAVDIAAIVGVAAVALVLWWRAGRRNNEHPDHASAP